MFTGIIETVGKVVSIETEGSNYHYEVESDISSTLKPDQSLSHNGVCLTVVKVRKNRHWVTAVDETLQKSNFKVLKPGSKVNLERSMAANGRFDGHLVQGHVDQTAECQEIKDMDGSWVFKFSLKPENKKLMVEKGSICINGISLTCFDITDNFFSVAIIPYTFENTNLGTLEIGDLVNLEFDIIGKYIARIHSS